MVVKLFLLATVLSIAAVAQNQPRTVYTQWGSFLAAPNCETKETCKVVIAIGANDSSVTAYRVKVNYSTFTLGAHEHIVYVDRERATTIAVTPLFPGYLVLRVEVKPLRDSAPAVAENVY